MSVLSTPARLMLSPFRGYAELARAAEGEGQPSQLVEGLRAEPYVPRTSDHAYRGSSTVDRVLRTFGWLGLVGVVLLRARKRRE